MDNEFGIKPLLFASVAGFIGAAIWAGIAYGANIEIGWIAWGIGGFVGAGMVMGGGRGPMATLAAVAITVLAICGGKVWGVNASINKMLEKELGARVNQESYNALVKESDDFALLKNETQYPAFMIANSYSEAATPQEVTKEELASFKQFEVPNLRSFKSARPTFTEWRTRQISLLGALFKAQVTFTDMLKSTLGLMDIVFFALGIITCLRIVGGNREG